MASKKQFRIWAKNHPNFMTPHIVTLYEKGNKIIEVSSGTGIEHEPIFGVTVATAKEEGKFDTGDSRSKMFFDKHEAIEYARKLKKVI